MAHPKGVHADVEFLDSEQAHQAIEADSLAGPAVPIPRSLPKQLSLGDCIYVPGYTARGPVCVSWSRRQQMSWAPPDEHCGEPCAVSEEHDGWTATITEEARMNAFLARIPADC